MMTRTLTFALIALASASAFVPTQAVAAPVVIEAGKFSSPMTNVAASCQQIGAQVAAQQGGTLAAASSATEGGRAVCKLVIVVPDNNGGRPQRKQITVDQS